MEIPQFQVKGLDNLHPNTTLEFTEVGIIVHVTLNIQPEVAKKLCPLNVFKGNKFLVYKVYKFVPSKYVTKTNIQKVQEYLLKNCMIVIREAKREVLKQQIHMIKNGN